MVVATGDEGQTLEVDYQVENVGNVAGNQNISMDRENEESDTFSNDTIETASYSNKVTGEVSANISCEISDDQQAGVSVEILDGDTVLDSSSDFSFADSGQSVFVETSLSGDYEDFDAISFQHSGNSSADVQHQVSLDTDEDSNIELESSQSSSSTLFWNTNSGDAGIWDIIVSSEDSTDTIQVEVQSV